MINLEPSAVNGWYCPDDPGEPYMHDKRLSVGETEGRILAEFARGRDVLEIGTGLGVATRAMLKTAQNLATVDIDPWVWENVFPDLERDGVGCYTSYDDIGALLYEVHFFEMAFVDGSHKFEHVVRDIKRVRRLVHVGGVLLFHDTKIAGVLDALKATHTRWTYIDSVAGLGLAWNDAA